MTAWLGDFHFLRPLWLLALLPTLALWWHVIRVRDANSWRHIIDAHLLPALLVERGGRGFGGDRVALTLLGLAWLLAVLALAGPTWDRQPQPVFQTLNSRVIVLDLSQSMAADDLKPSRLVRARFKVIDILNRSEDAQVGLVAFAGDAFVVSPITQDTATVRNLLPVLEPSLMPVQGSRIDRALALAGELLERAEAAQGSVILISDGAASADDARRALDAAAELRAQGYRLSVLGVGTASGAPILTAAGELLKNADGAIVIPRLDAAALADLATAGGGRYATIRADGQDLATVLAETAFSPLSDEARQVEQETAAWQERGPWLVVALLPLAALAFRRGWLLSLAAVLLLTSPFASLPLAYAQNANQPQTRSPALPQSQQVWQDLWLRRDQQALGALSDGDPQRAARLAIDPWLRGTAAYRAGDFALAERAFAAVPGASGAYNRGNALTHLQRYQEAISAYDAALQARPDFPEAEANRKLARQLLQQQQHQQQQQQSAENQENGDSGKQPSSGSNQNSQDNSASSDSSQAADSASEAMQQGGSPQGNDDGSLSQAQPDQSGSATDDSPQQRREQNSADGQTDASDAPPDADPNSAEQPHLAGEEALSDEERQALDHLLQRIPDDPGGLLRTKFLRQYQRRAVPANPDAPNW